MALTITLFTLSYLLMASVTFGVSARTIYSDTQYFTAEDKVALMVFWPVNAIVLIVYGFIKLADKISGGRIK